MMCMGGFACVFVCVITIDPYFKVKDIILT